MTFKYKSRLWIERKSEFLRDFFEAKWVKFRLRLVFLLATYRASPGIFWLFIQARLGSVAAYDRLMAELLPPMVKLAYLYWEMPSWRKRPWFWLPVGFFRIYAVIILIDPFLFFSFVL